MIDRSTLSSPILSLLLPSMPLVQAREQKSLTLDMDSEVSGPSTPRSDSILRKLLPTSPWRPRRRSASAARPPTLSPLHSPSPTPRFNRLAASLRLPHYCGRGRISSPRRASSRSSSKSDRASTTLPHGVTFRSFSHHGESVRERERETVRSTCKTICSSARVVVVSAATVVVVVVVGVPSCVCKLRRTTTVGETLEKLLECIEKRHRLPIQQRVLKTSHSARLISRGSN